MSRTVKQIVDEILAESDYDGDWNDVPAEMQNKAREILQTLKEMEQMYRREGGGMEFTRYISRPIADILTSPSSRNIRGLEQTLGSVMAGLDRIKTNPES